MFRPRFVPARQSRRGVILLVVLVLLTLFAVVGLSFVLYADAEAKSAQIYREAEVQGRADMEPELLLSFFLGQLIYDADDQTGVYSALRGHSLARLLYGYNDPPDLNGTPFNGTGRLHEPIVFHSAGVTADGYYLVNYTCFQDANGNLIDGFLRDPERLGTRSTLTLSARGPFTGGFNVPYTYPDLNNMFLAAVKADGTVLLPSFHRPWTNFGSLDPSNTNWNTPSSSDPTLKYRVLRPRPADMGPGFPATEDAGGDVKNLIGAPGGNDSIWLDLGAPVMMTPAGRKYKPLFAPLIVDLDNRVNVNLHGNVRGWLPYINPPNPPNPPAAQQAHVSNQGWGPWDVNLGLVLNNAGAPNEWTQLVLGRTAPTVYGRYGGDQQPATSGSVAQAGMVPHFYGQADYDGCNEQNGYVPTGQLQLPGAGAGVPYSCFPSFPQGYGNGSTLEGTNHPSLYNALRPAGDDRVFATSNMEALLRYGDTGSQSMTSELLRLCPTNFADTRTRRLVTTRSFDIDKPGVTPWVWDPTAQPYLLATGALAPSGAPIPFPALTLRSGAVPTGSEFGTYWRARDASLGRVDLSAALPDYPAPDPTTGQITNLPGFQAAQQTRQVLAGLIFRRLWRVTGASDPATVSPGTPQYDALRWLAQLAVNIVDYLDDDDYMTPFFWNPNLPTEVVFGTELPRVVINEAYADWTQASGATLTTVRVWVELLNPFNQDPVDPTQGAAPLGTATIPGVYQIALCQPDSTPTFYRRNDNVWGTPYPFKPGDPPKFVYPVTIGGPDAVTNTWGTDNTLEVSSGQGGPNGYYLVGPTAFPNGGASGPPVRNTSTNMQYQVNVPTAGNAPPAPSVLLQRLACSYLPLQTDPTQPLYNPYITVDYLQQLDDDGTGLIRANNNTNQNPNGMTGNYNGQSDGRNQPYAGNTALRTFQTFPPGVTLQQPQNSFPQPANGINGVNSQVPNPANFSWLVHLNRPLISPMELLHVSAFKPHELTQQFMTVNTAGNPIPFNHRAPWFDPGARIYRILEFLETHDRAAGIATLQPGGRVPGKVNINTIWDAETFRALCDAQTSNYFTPAQVDVIFRQLLTLRTPNFSTSGPGPTDRPFWSLAAPYSSTGDLQYPNGIGINDTCLRSAVAGGDATTPRLFQNTNVAHPYLQDELLTKIFNHLTTRSNVFAIWLTVGFFDVTDDTTRPVKLGAEIGRAENRHIRHRLFAIVDRSALDANFGPRPRFNARADPVLVPHFSIIN